MWRKGNPLTLFVGMQTSTATMDKSVEISQKPEVELSYNPATLLQGIHTEETRIERDTCTLMFITALFTIARTWKQARCLLADEWIRKLCYIYRMEYQLSYKKRTRLSQFFFFFNGIFQARILEWVAISFSKGSS